MRKGKLDRVWLTVLICLGITLAMGCTVLVALRSRGEAKPAPTPAPTASPTPTPAPTPAPTPVPTPTPVPYDPPEELVESIGINPHVIAWLEGRDFDTFNTVIYGHNMANETYFGSLKYYNDESFRDAHREIDIYTPTKALRYDVFAVVTYDDRYITDRYRDEKREDRMAFLRSLLEFSPVVYDDVSVGPDSHILTLSTCIGGMPNNRLLILAVLREPAASPAPAPAALPDKGEAGKIRKN